MIRQSASDALEQSADKVISVTEIQLPFIVKAVAWEWAKKLLQNG